MDENPSDADDCDDPGDDDGGWDDDCDVSTDQAVSDYMDSVDGEHLDANGQPGVERGGVGHEDLCFPATIAAKVLLVYIGSPYISHSYLYRHLH